jgi:hypothetical protein
MSSTTSAARLTPPERIVRGLKYSTVGPVDLTRGALGVGFGSARSSAAWMQKRYRRGRIKTQLARDLAAAQEAIAFELAAAQEVVANLPAALQEARSARRRRRPLLLFGAGVTVLAVGAVAFSIIRRSTQPEPSPLPPSVDIAPRP